MEGNRDRTKEVKVMNKNPIICNTLRTHSVLSQALVLF